MPHRERQYGLHVDIMRMSVPGEFQVSACVAGLTAGVRRALAMRGAYRLKGDRMYFALEGQTGTSKGRHLCRATAKRGRYRRVLRWVIRKCPPRTRRLPLTLCLSSLFMGR